MRYHMNICNKCLILMLNTKVFLTIKITINYPSANFL